MTIGVGGSNIQDELKSMRLLSEHIENIPEEEYSARIKKATVLMQQQNVDAIFFSCSTNLRYFLNLNIYPSERLHGAAINKMGDIVYIVPSFEKEKTETMITLVGNLFTWEEDENPAKIVMDSFTFLGVTRGIIAIDENTPFFIFDATNHPYLEKLEIYSTGIYNIDLSQNQNLWFLSIGSNPDLWSLDLSNNYFLEHLDLYSNSLSNLDMRNGNNQNMSYFVTWNCWNSQFLDCISVDDSTYSTNNWTSIDSWHYFSNNCNPLAIQEHSSKKEILKITDLLGRETKGTKNELLFYIYDDGTVEKIITIE